MTLYLKYRPQKVSELDLPKVREMLGHILKGDHDADLPHAFLFSGPRGIGKTSAARILAKTVNCEKPKKGESCGECEACLDVASGVSFDVVEIDAASNRGIEEIRDLREKVKLAPMRGKYKVYIIDEVHMLTTEAANALLKTLEEPPKHVLFVLCTTEPEKLPITVVSRCTRVDFSRPQVVDILEKLKVVVGGESAKIGEKDLTMIASAARGSFRDGIKILEQVIMAGGDVKAVLGMVEGVEPDEFVDLVRNKDRQEALLVITKLVDGGGSVRGFIEKCVETLREEILNGLGNPEKLALDITLVEALEKAYERTKTTAVPQLPLELFVIESCGRSVKSPENEGKPEEVKIQPRQDVAAKVSGAGKYKLEDMVGKWQEVMKLVRPQNHSVEALLRSTRPVDFDGEKLELEVFYKFHKDKLESEKCRQIIEGAITDVFGINSVRLFLRLGEKPPFAKVSERQEKSDGVSGLVDEDIVRAAEEIFKVEAI